MADEDPLPKILHLLDVLSVQVGTTQAGVERIESRVDALATETRSGFDRVERRLGNLETRVEGIETEFRVFRGETERRVSSLEERIN